MSRGTAAREFLRWCAPALLVGLVLRALLAVQMPYAYVQHDSIRLLVSGETWLGDDYDVMSNNVPFLVPGFCKLAQALPIPALITIQLVQHTLGLIQILLAGALVRLWLPRWKWWIIPATLVFAVHPSFLWYEHVVMLETFYVFTLMLMALAATWFLQARTMTAAALLCVSVIAVAVTRPEGKLMLAFAALVLAVGFFGRWKQLAGAAGLLAVSAGIIKCATVPGESGLLLYSSVIHLSAATPKHYPEAAPYVETLRTEAIENAKKQPAFVSRPQREALEAALTRFVNEHPGAGRGETTPQRMNSVAKAIAYETCLAHPFALFPLALQKFRLTAGELASGKFTQSYLHDRQNERVRGAWRFLRPIASRLYGREFADVDAATAHVDRIFPKEIGWFCWLEQRWEDLYDGRFPATRYPAMKLPGLPRFYVLPVLGMLVGIFWPTRARSFHVCWVLTLVGLWFIIMITANERSRFRMAFEPFIFLYPFILLDGAAELVTRRLRSSTELPAPQPST